MVTKKTIAKLEKALDNLLDVEEEVKELGECGSIDTFRGAVSRIQALINRAEVARKD